LKTILLAVATSLLCALTIHAEKIVLTGGTLVRPSNNQILPDATVLIDRDRIANVVAPPDKLDIPNDARVIDCKGKFILPGYIDTHVHFFQSGDLFTRPDAVDLTKIRPYADEMAWIKRNLPDTFQRYLRSGITSVVDVGGPFWNFGVRKIANGTAKRRA
jgi:cytosine/adenosine deaminase-related metal-dependent hydrolase